MRLKSTWRITTAWLTMLCSYWLTIKSWWVRTLIKRLKLVTYWIWICSWLRKMISLRMGIRSLSKTRSPCWSIMTSCRTQEPCLSKMSDKFVSNSKLLWRQWDPEPVNFEELYIGIYICLRVWVFSKRLQTKKSAKRLLSQAKSEVTAYTKSIN